ncbi:MAG: hypothetical protein CM1200mP28_07410 [Deltaproteobacteria bacterium]|nr:MAG: hypothetical protein CM1200mP28_07410 [Deltaproteobacteria bacterium]
MAEETLVLFKNIRNPKYSKSLEGYKKAGGYQTLKKVFGMKPKKLFRQLRIPGSRTRRSRIPYRSEVEFHAKRVLASQVILLPTPMNLNLEHARTGN